MKNLKFLLLLLLCFFICCGESKEDLSKIISEAEKQINLPYEVVEDLELKTSVEVNNYKVQITWESNSANITNSGVVTRTYEDIEVTLKATFSLEDLNLVKEYKLIILRTEKEFDYEAFFNEAFDKIEIKQENNKLVIPEKVFVDEKEVKVNYKIDGKLVNSDYTINKFFGKKDVNIYISITYQGKEAVRDISFELIGIDREPVIMQALSLINESLPKTITKMPDNGIVNVDNIAIEYRFEGSIERKIDENTNTTLTVALFALGEDIYETLDFEVLSYLGEMVTTVDEIIIPSETNENIELLKKINDISLEWSSDNERLLTNNGEVKYTKESKTITLALLAIWEIDGEEIFYDKEYQITINPFSEERCIELALEKIKMPTEVSSNITIDNNSYYDVSLSWETSDESAITKDGIVTQTTVDKQVTLTLTLEKNSVQKVVYYDILVKKIDLDGCDDFITLHNYTDNATNFDQNNFDGVELKNGRLVLTDGALQGTYTSKKFKIKDVNRVVGSYSCISSKDALGNLEISLRVNGVWSGYVSYGDYGLGSTNLYYNQENDLIKISTDEIIVQNSKTADAIRYRFTMKRTSKEVESPQLLNVSFALIIPSYSYAVDTSLYPNQVLYDVPKLYQHDVPVIGSVICSATTTTMLLKYLGYSFTDKGYKLEHEYIANMVADRGHNNPTYGNWSYNMITAGAFGTSAKVYRIYSMDELMMLLKEIGPVGLNISGTISGTNINGSSHSYSTGGHLVCVTGYEIINGTTYFILNDPNVYGVYFKVTKQVLGNVSKNITYIVQKI